MRSFWSQLIGLSTAPLTVVVMDQAHTGRPAQHEVRPRTLLLGVLAAGLLLVGGVLALALLTPLRELAPGYGSARAITDAQSQRVRLAALEDSLQLQQEYIAHFRALLSGQVDVAADRETSPPITPPATTPADRRAVPASSMPLPVQTTGAGAVAAVWTGEPTSRVRPDDAGGLPLPAPTPVQGFLTRGFDARTGHFGVDIATAVGSAVRTVGDGFVIFADWSYEGGNTIAVQHADGYVSVYKHNDRLLRRAGERVRARDAIAISGNTGEISTGPHLHFELWRDGLPQDPRAFVLGW